MATLVYSTRNYARKSILVYEQPFNPSVNRFINAIMQGSKKKLAIKNRYLCTPNGIPIRHKNI